MEKRYSSTLSLTSALDGGGWSTPCPGRFTPGKDQVPIVRGGRMGPRTGLDGFGKSRPPPNGIRSTDRPAGSKSLHRLSYSGPPLPTTPSSSQPPHLRAEPEPVCKINGHRSLSDTVTTFLMGFFTVRPTRFKPFGSSLAASLGF